MINLRFYWTVTQSLPYATYVVPKAEYMSKHPEKYSRQDCFDFARHLFKYIKRKCYTVTEVYGRENIPDTDNCVFYSNHEGKYDAVGILDAMERPCSVLWERKQSRIIIAKQVCDLLNGVTIDLNDMRDKVRAIARMTDRLKSGYNMLVFPEGGYNDEKKNSLTEFQSGCFACAFRAKSTVVPVTIYDSYKALNSDTFEKVTTQVHFLNPINYSEYKDMTKNQLMNLVKDKISERLKNIELGNFAYGENGD